MLGIYQKFNKSWAALLTVSPVLDAGAAGVVRLPAGAQGGDARLRRGDIRQPADSRDYNTCKSVNSESNQ